MNRRFHFEQNEFRRSEISDLFLLQVYTNVLLAYMILFI